MAIGSGTGRAQPASSLKDRLSNPELRTPNRSLHFIGDFKRTPYIDSPPYNGAVEGELIEQTPNIQPTVKEKIWEYRGGSAIVASPGDVISRIYGTTIVQGRVIWSTKPYLNDNNQPVIDVAYGLCEGTIDGLLKIYGGNDKQILWGSNSIEGESSGGRYWKRKKLHFGSQDQLQNNIIKNHKGEDDTPTYRGLSYIVFKGLKLFKFNNTCPDLWFVLGRQVDNVVEQDEYPVTGPINYVKGDGTDVSSITGIPGEDFVYVTTSGVNIFRVELSTNTWTDLGTASNTNCSSNVLGILNDKLYYLHFNDLMLYDTGTTWNVAVNTAFLSYRMQVSPDRTKMIYFDTGTSLTKLYLYNGATPIDQNYPGSGLGYGAIRAAEVNDSGDIWVIATKASNDMVIFRKLFGGSWSQTDIHTHNYTSIQGVKIDPNNDYMHYSHYNNSDSDFYHEHENFIATPGIPDNTVNKIITDSINRVSDIEYFSNRYHFIRNIGGVTKYFREEINGTITDMPLPTGYSFSRILMIQKIGTKLYVGTNDGFFQASDVPN